MVTGIGGVFQKASDPRLLAGWYEENLGIGFGGSTYFSFKWRSFEKPDEICHTVFSFFPDDTDYFYPGDNDMMINLRVDDLDDLRIRLRQSGSEVIDKIETYAYGRFGWVVDPAGNKVELWDANDQGFENINKPMGLTHVTGISGIYQKTPDPKRMVRWYSNYFGLFSSQELHTFRSRDYENPESAAHTVLAYYPDDSAYFTPSQKNSMISFRVHGLDVLLRKLRSKGIEVLEESERYNHGKFAWLLDPEGNKIELWEPVGISDAEN